MDNTTGIKEGETVMIGTNHYKRVGTKLVNLNNSADTIDVTSNSSLVDIMLEKLNIVNG
jgi:hypothetical protein